MINARVDSGCSEMCSHWAAVFTDGAATLQMQLLLRRTNEITQ